MSSFDAKSPACKYFHRRFFGEREGAIKGGSQSRVDQVSS